MRFLLLFVFHLEHCRYCDDAEGWETITATEGTAQLTLGAVYPLWVPRKRFPYEDLSFSAKHVNELAPKASSPKIKHFYIYWFPLCSSLLRTQVCHCHYSPSRLHPPPKFARWPRSSAAPPLSTNLYLDLVSCRLLAWIFAASLFLYSWRLSGSVQQIHQQPLPSDCDNSWIKHLHT